MLGPSGLGRESILVIAVYLTIKSSEQLGLIILQMSTFYKQICLTIGLLLFASNLVFIRREKLCVFVLSTLSFFSFYHFFPFLVMSLCIISIFTSLKYSTKSILFWIVLFPWFFIPNIQDTLLVQNFQGLGLLLNGIRQFHFILSNQNFAVVMVKHLR